jgi:membrane-associated HD superfamily phosphohydrolase
MKDGMIIKGNWSNFLGLKGEELLLVQRRHIFLLVYPIFLNFLIFSIFSAAAYFIFSYVLPSIPLLIISLLLMLCMAISLSIYTAVYWYFHLYILTNRKILEVKYTPLFSHVVNDIFLDKVNCTEIDLSSKGFLHELIDMGDVTITFDRPTHQEEFVLQNIKNCDEIGRFLTQKLMDGRKERLGDILWFRSRSNLVSKPII